MSNAALKTSDAQGRKGVGLVVRVKTTMLTALSLAAMLSGAAAICFCPPTCIPTSQGNCWYRDVALCNDLEAEQECLQANQRLSDTKDSFVSNGVLFLSSMVVQGRLSAEGASFLRTQLSIAVDQGIPRADCSAVATQTVVRNTLSHCYSPTLLYACSNISAAATTWTAGIGSALNASIATNAHPAPINATVSSAFVAAIAARAAANTVDINCSYFDSASRTAVGAAVAVAVAVAVALVLL